MTTNPISAAVEAMYEDYEALIADPAAVLDQWEEYGSYDACHLCNAVAGMPGADKNPYYKHSCQAHCPLGPRNIMELKKCKKWPSCTKKRSYFDEMCQALEEGDAGKIQDIATKRLAWLKNRINSRS